MSPVYWPKWILSLLAFDLADHPGTEGPAVGGRAARRGREGYEPGDLTVRLAVGIVQIGQGCHS